MSVKPKLIPAISDADKKTLKTIAEHIAEIACVNINRCVHDVKTPTVPCKAQCVLEYLIEILQTKVC